MPKTPKAHLKEKRKPFTTHTIEFVKKIAQERGGKCLSPEYINSKQLLEFECGCGNKWFARFVNIYNLGRWCPKCGGSQKLSIEPLQEIATKHGGKLLSPIYTNTKTKLHWLCSCGNDWWQKPDHILRGHWCKKCADKKNAQKKKPKIEDIAKRLEQAGYTLESTTYFSAKDHLEIKCKFGHTTDPSFDYIKNAKNFKNLCSKCNEGFGEAIVRKCFELMLGIQFPRTRPEWLLSKKGYPLELDGYNPTLKLAFEHQGKHHYGLTEYIKDGFKQVEASDKIKIAICKKKGIALIRVPEIPFYLTLEELIVFLEKKFTRLNLAFNKISITDLHIESYSYSKVMMEKLEAIVQKRGAKLIDTVFKGSQAKYKIRCANNHDFSSYYYNLLKGSWCGHCSKRIKYTLEYAQKIANERTGTLKSKVYRGAHYKLKWICKNNHPFPRSLASVLTGRWCNECNGTSKYVAKKNRT